MKLWKAEYSEKGYDEFYPETTIHRTKRGALCSLVKQRRQNIDKNWIFWSNEEWRHLHKDDTSKIKEMILKEEWYSVEEIEIEY